MMAILDRVRGFVERLTPESVCDDCIADRLDLSSSGRANLAARELAGASGFERRTAACTLCGITRTVTRRVK